MADVVEGFFIQNKIVNISRAIFFLSVQNCPLMSTTSVKNMKQRSDTHHVYLIDDMCIIIMYDVID